MMVKENIMAAQAKQKRDYDRKHAKPSLFRVGAIVLAKDYTRKKRKGGKLDTRWLGPFKIEKVLPRGGIYHIISANGSKKKYTGAHLKPYKQPEKGMWYVPC